MAGLAVLGEWLCSRTSEAFSIVSDSLILWFYCHPVLLGADPVTSTSHSAAPYLQGSVQRELRALSNTKSPQFLPVTPAPSKKLLIALGKTVGFL